MDEWIEVLKIDNSQTPVNIVKIVKENGFEVGNMFDKKRMQYCLLAANVNFNGGIKTIAVSSQLPLVNKRVFVAFAFGYYFKNIEELELRRKGKFFLKIKELDVYRKLKEDKEILDFVLELLLPKERIQEELKTKTGLLPNTIIMILASKYQVPEFLVEYRLKQIFKSQNVSQKENNPDEETKRISLELPKK